MLAVVQGRSPHGEQCKNILYKCGALAVPLQVRDKLYFTPLIRWIPKKLVAPTVPKPAPACSEACCRQIDHPCS